MVLGPPVSGPTLLVFGAPQPFNSAAVTIQGGSNPDNVALTVVSNSSGEGLLVFGQSATGQSLGLTVIAGTNASDINSAWFNITPSGTGEIQLMKLAGDGSLVVGPVATPSGGPGTVGVSSGYYINGILQPPVFSAILTSNVVLTSTVLSDTPLSVSLPVGYYAVDLFLNFNGLSTGTQGIQFGNSGTAGINASLGSTVGSVAGTAQNGNFVGALSFATVSVAFSVDFLVIRTAIQVTSSGTYTIQAAQNSASANASEVLIGSQLRLTKLG